MTEASGPELVIGLVGAIGTDLHQIAKSLQTSLTDVNYATDVIRLIRLLYQIEKWKDLPKEPGEDHYKEHIRAGREFCSIMGRGDALSTLAVARIRELRKEKTGDPLVPSARQAYIIHSLKRPEEVATLRRIYGSGFVLIAAYSPREIRINNLARKFAASQHVFDSDLYRSSAEALAETDEKELGETFGQNVASTFALADAFLNASDPKELQQSVNRLIRILFGHPFETPTPEENAMMHARVASLRSSDLARQVGCAITAKSGEVVALGTNDVPKAGGGLYWEGDKKDRRDFQLSKDTSYSMRRRLLSDVLNRLALMGWLESGKTTQGIEALTKEALASKESQLKDARIMDAIEYGRTVHAEMDAITDCARRGIPVAGCTLYTTTFPCHICARHIVASGISRVVYIEPYHKSLAFDLFDDSISVDSPHRPHDSVLFEHFVGISYTRYIDLFAMLGRKTDEGELVDWKRDSAKPRLTGVVELYRAEEVKALEGFEQQMQDRGLNPIN